MKKNITPTISPTIIFYIFENKGEEFLTINLISMPKKICISLFTYDKYVFIVYLMLVRHQIKIFISVLDFHRM